VGTMRFYDRERELARLDEIASLSRRASHLAVVTGRRRVGKTELIRRFAEGWPQNGAGRGSVAAFRSEIIAVP